MATRLDERQALEKFCADAYAPLVGAFSLTVHDRFLAEELAQEALLRACRRWAHVRTLQSPIGWCYRVGVNLSRNVARRDRTRRRAETRRGDRGIHVDEDISARVAVQRALLDLTTKQREAIVLRYFLGLSAEEAGSVLRLSAVAVRGLTHRGVLALGGVLGAEDDTVEANDGA